MYVTIDFTSHFPGYSPGQAHVGFVVHREVFLSVFFSFPLSVSFQMRLWFSELAIADIT